MKHPEENISSVIAQSALRVARHVHDGSFAGVIVSGGSHQLSRALLALGWGVLYPSEPMPRTFVLDAEGNALLYKSTLPDARGVFQPDAKGFREWIRTHAPGLEQLENAPLVLVDDFMLSGVKYREMKEFLPRYHGFRNVSFAFFASKGEDDLESEAFVGVQSRAVIAELQRLGQHIQGKENVEEMLSEIRPEAKRLRADALGELREIGLEMKR
jgi:hypothetical protein